MYPFANKNTIKKAKINRLSSEMQLSEAFNYPTNQIPSFFTLHSLVSLLVPFLVAALVL